MRLDAFWSNIFRLNDVKDIFSILKNIPLFQDLKSFELIKLSRTLHHRSFFQNEIIFREKEPGAGMYIVKSGQVKIFIKTNEGKEHELTRLEKGDFFGEISLIDESPRSAWAIALEDTELMGFFRSDLLNLMDRDPILSSKILMHLAMVIGKRLRQTNLDLKKIQYNVP